MWQGLESVGVARVDVTFSGPLIIFVNYFKVELKCSLLGHEIIREDLLTLLNCVTFPLL